MTVKVGDSPPRTNVGYCWPWTVRPGESLDFMVSADASAGTYSADLVRIICGEGLANPALFKEQELPAPFARSYAARQQLSHLGSYVESAPHPALDQLGSFTIQAMVMPTLLPGGIRIPPGGPPLLVKLKEGEAATWEGYLVFLEGKMPKWWLPQKIVFVDDISLGPTGKIDKNAIRKRYESIWSHG